MTKNRSINHRSMDALEDKDKAVLNFGQLEAI